MPPGLLAQARRQEIKWGVVKVENVFFVKVENWGVLGESGKWGCFVKSGRLLNAGCILCDLN